MILHAYSIRHAIERRVAPARPVAGGEGDFAAAKRLFRILTTVRPDAAKAWQRLGQVCEVSVSTRKHCASTSNSCGCNRGGKEDTMLTMTRNVRHWLAAAITSGAPPFGNRMVRRWISCHGFETERISSPGA
jgi:hypothetical protein